MRREPVNGRQAGLHGMPTRRTNRLDHNYTSNMPMSLVAHISAQLLRRRLNIIQILGGGQSRHRRRRNGVAEGHEWVWYGSGRQLLNVSIEKYILRVSSKVNKRPTLGDTPQ